MEIIVMEGEMQGTMELIGLRSHITMFHKRRAV